jgi:hypothetical protein
MFYNPRPPAPTTVRAWLDAGVALKTAGGSLGGVMLHIKEPCRVDDDEAEVLKHVDGFLRKHKAHPIATVSNTIFPAALDRGDGIEGLKGRYLAVYDRRMCRQGEWGRYFHRMIAWEGAKRPVNQLATIIEMLRTSASEGGRFYENTYEIALFDPARDLRRRVNRQCLSLIELKPERCRRLHMMALYRNHFYIQRTLGNLIGLGRLLDFIAREAGLSVGSLTIQSTHAELDIGSWGKSEIEQLIGECGQLLLKKAA